MSINVEVPNIVASAVGTEVDVETETTPNQGLSVAVLRIIQEVNDRQRTGYIWGR